MVRVLVEERQSVLMRGERMTSTYMRLPMEPELDLSSLSRNHICAQRREDLSPSRRRSGIHRSRSSYGPKRGSKETYQASRQSAHRS